jgi:hypothetical protein
VFRVGTRPAHREEEDMAGSTHGLQQRLLGLGTEKLQELMGEMMKNEHFQQALGKAMTRAFSAKSQLDRNMELLLGIFSVPSRGDVRRLEDKLEALAGKIAALTMRLDALGTEKPAAQAARPAQPTRPAARKRAR